MAREKQEDEKQEAKQEQEEVTFITNFDVLGISIKPPRKIVIDGEVLLEKGNRIEFNRGTFTTSDKEETAFLREYIKNSKEGVVITEVKK